MFLIINVVLPVGIVVMVFSSPIVSNGGDVEVRVTRTAYDP